MKLLTLTLAAAVVMAATGCETTQQKSERMKAKGYVKTMSGKWVPEGTPFFGDGKPIGVPNFSMIDPTVFNRAFAPAAPAPVVVAGGGGSGVTMASQVGNTTIVSQFGGYRPTTYTPPPIIDTSGPPIYYTEAVQQP